MSHSAVALNQSMNCSVAPVSINIRRPGAFMFKQDRIRDPVCKIITLRGARVHRPRSQRIGYANIKTEK